MLNQLIGNEIKQMKCPGFKFRPLHMIMNYLYPTSYDHGDSLFLAFICEKNVSKYQWLYYNT